MAKLTLQTLNDQLSAAYCRAKVEQIKNKLYLRATLPPKPGEDKTEWRQQRIPLRCNATPEGLREAKTMAFAVSASLDKGQFDWGEFIASAPKTLTVADAIARFERQYFQARPRTPTTENSFSKHYTAFFKQLPQQSSLTKALLIETLVNRYPPDTYARKSCYRAYQSLSRTCLGEDLGKPHLRGTYSPDQPDPGDLPSDKTIERTRRWIRNPDMVACYDLMACYGLRPSECFWVDPDSLRDPNGVIRVKTHKSRKPYWRLVYPSRPDWVRRWQISAIALPKRGAEKTNNELGRRITEYFRKHREIPFNAYMLRHAYAARLAAKNVDSAVAAKWMGHSNDIHCRIYHKFLDRNHFDAVFKACIRED
ncbi:MAG: tyrosine-type recombinase/integrase [Halothece sp.]